VVIVDDGMATGATAVVACRVARARGADRVVVAMPVSSDEAVTRLEDEADEVVCPLVPRWLGGVGGAYRDFHQLTDAEVRSALRL
jgi:putative phosphoribosyl transferase